MIVRSGGKFPGSILLFLFVFSFGIALNSQSPHFFTQKNKGDEFLVNTNLSYFMAEGWQPKVAYGEDQILIVWEDPWRSCIMGARIQTDGLYQGRCQLF